nr:riboflavin biosynthesis protein RibF [Segatella maculosa]
MNTIFLSEENNAIAPCVGTIGFFDGVHRGHQFLIKQVKEAAEAGRFASTVITFDRHPRQVLHSNYVPQLLTTLEDKLLLLSKTGIDNTAVLHFDEAMARLSAFEFMQQVLRDRLKVKQLFIGYDNRFGHNREEKFDDYARYGRELGIDVVHSEAFLLHGVNVSSSVIRSFLQAGEVEMARQCLGYPYTFVGKWCMATGKVTRWASRQPTSTRLKAANSRPNRVYAVTIKVENDAEVHHGMMNIGTRPTFEGQKLTQEVHLFDFDGDLYNKQIHVSFVHRIREERRFNNAFELVEQLRKDRSQIKEQLKNETE